MNIFFCYLYRLHSIRIEVRAKQLDFAKSLLAKGETTFLCPFLFCKYFEFHNKEAHVESIVYYSNDFILCVNPGPIE